MADDLLFLDDDPDNTEVRALLEHVARMSNSQDEQHRQRIMEALDDAAEKLIGRRGPEYATLQERIHVQRRRFCASTGSIRQPQT